MMSVSLREQPGGIRVKTPWSAPWRWTSWLRVRLQKNYRRRSDVKNVVLIAQNGNHGSFLGFFSQFGHKSG
jgi:hypothetical protein